MYALCAAYDVKRVWNLKKKMKRDPGERGVEVTFNNKN